MRHAEIGFTVIELLVALVIFALVATAAAQTLSTAHRARGDAANLMRATQLAAERLERIRAGDRGDDEEPLGIFERSWQSRIADPALGLERVDVRVAWHAARRQELTLSMLMRRPR
jgi:prepilin-type N-terminal cleavage/methylation domain-containing protein